MAVLVGLIVIAAVAVATTDREPRRGDADADGRYQWIEWDTPDEDGAPMRMLLFTGDLNGESDGVSIAVSTDLQGHIGSLGVSGHDVLDRIVDRLRPPRPTVEWDLSTYPPGSKFTFETSYLDASGIVTDTETITTTRPAR